MTNREMSLMLTAALGPLEQEWEMASGGTKDEEWFTVIRYCGSLKKGQIRRIHALLEDVLGETLGEGERD